MPPKDIHQRQVELIERRKNNGQATTLRDIQEALYTQSPPKEGWCTIV